MRGILIFILLIPAFIALGHDFYLFYNEHLNPGFFSIDLLKEEFKFSALGYIWTTYDEASYKTVVQSMAPEDWAQIDKFLTYKAFFVALAFAAAILGLLFIIGLLGKGPFAGENTGSSSGKVKKSKEPESFRSGTKSKKISYKRK